jgi:leader peptidase (prepilin peptidase)/N-methyltransferase
MADWPGLLILSPFIGSFMGLLIRRLPRRRKVVVARSACESCGHILGVADLVPLGSFLVLGGRCGTCGAKIHAMHLVVELAAIGIAVWSIACAGDARQLWLDCGLGWTLLTLAWIDWEHMLLPDALTLPLLLAGLAANWLLDGPAIADHAAAAALGYFSFRAIAFGYRKLRGRHGLGGGDAKLAAAGGAWVGLESLSTLVLTAALLGLATALVLRLRHGNLDGATVVPFGPALCAAIWLVWLYGAAPAMF